jgi:hypothetical protein
MACLIFQRGAISANRPSTAPRLRASCLSIQRSRSRGNRGPRPFCSCIHFLHHVVVDFLSTRMVVFCLISFPFRIRIPMLTKWPQSYLSFSAHLVVVIYQTFIRNESLMDACPIHDGSISKRLFQVTPGSISCSVCNDFIVK